MLGYGAFETTMDTVAKAVAQGPWILGEKFSAADIMLGSGLNFAVRMFKMVQPRPSFDAYIDRCVARPAFQRAEAIMAG
jgi:glutathione S-transferase